MHSLFGLFTLVPQVSAMDHRSCKLSQQVQAVKDQIADLVEKDFKLSNHFYLFRWLQASKFDVERTVKAVRANIKWRVENQVNEMLYQEPDPNFTSKFPYFYGMKGKDRRPVLYLHAAIIDFPGLVKEFGIEKTLQQLVHHMVIVEKEVYDWDNEWDGPLETLPVERAKGAFFIVDTEDLTMKKAASATALKMGLKWTRLFVNYFPTHCCDGRIISAPSFVHIPCKLFIPVIAAIGASLYVFPDNGTRDEEMEREIFSVITPKQLEELRARAKTVEECQKTVKT